MESASITRMPAASIALIFGDFRDDTKYDDRTWGIFYTLDIVMYDMHKACVGDAHDAWCVSTKSTVIPDLSLCGPIMQQYCI